MGSVVELNVWVDPVVHVLENETVHSYFIIQQTIIKL